ncbi:MAG: aromatic amino acid ammonia-lyase, partial [Roseibacillus sp.]|nr:aromatic amino acid ammonia-lyase [Roseibacillus sp.]
MLWLLKAGSGERIGSDAVRAGMLLRLNSLLRGVSGIRMDLLRRLETFLNEDVVPHVLGHGSIGASGDLVPLAYVTGALIGLDNDFRVDLRGEEMGAVEALAQLGLDRERLRAKEGLALINGNSMMTGLAALCVADTKDLLLLAHGVHALAVQALCGSEASFAPFIHEHKPHPGQLRSAAWMRALLAASRMTTEGVKGHYAQPDNALIQDRYSLRCLPQFMAPLLEGIAHIEGQIEIEANCANDNPLFDVETGTTYNGGNFLGQVVGVGMDQLRFYIGLMAKHLDTQLSLLMSPEFSNGLPMSLSGDPNRTWNMGLKGLQLLGNSMMPILTFMGNTMTDRF